MSIPRSPGRPRSTASSTRCSPRSASSSSAARSWTAPASSCTCDRRLAVEYSSLMDDELPSDPILGLNERRRLERSAVEEAGGGESEGFELAEQELIEHASHGDDHTPARIIRDAGPQEEPASSVYGEADEEHLSDQ